MEKINLSRSASPDDVVQVVRDFGIARIPNYLNDVGPIKEEVLEMFEGISSNYENGKAIRSDQNWDLSRSPKTSSFFKDSKWMLEITRKYQDVFLGFFQGAIFATHDYIADQGIGPQSWAHFDRLQRFKFFLYLTDVEEDCGAFHADPGSHKITKELRKADPNPGRVDRWRFGRHFGDKGICGEKDHQDGAINGSQNHYPDIEYNLTPITGPAGTLIVFDSDVIHKGGAVSPGRSRLVVRGHSW